MPRCNKQILSEHNAYYATAQIYGPANLVFFMLGLGNVSL
jgi:hypothetical protein